jgi:deoxycytidylate deaminase
MSDSLDDDTPTGSVIVKEKMIIGIGANGTDFHKKNPCVRVIKKIPTGQGYDLCEGLLVLAKI